MPAGFQVPSIFSAIDRLTAPMRMMTRGVMGFARLATTAVARVDRAFIRFGRTLKTLTGGLGLFLGAALAFSVLSGGIRILSDYEQANANLAAVTRATSLEMVMLKNNSFDLGKSTRFTASEVAGLQTELGKLGFTAIQVVKASESILALASATNTELPQAALQVGNAIRAFGLKAKDAARVSDVFAAGVSSSALDMEKLSVAMSKIAPVATKFGFSIENTVALMASLADAGFDASTMATSTRSILLNLADSSGSLARALGRPARTLPEITQAMIDMRERGIDLAKLLKLTDKRSVAAAATFLEAAESIGVFSKKMDGAIGTAKLMALIQMDTLQGSVFLLKSAYDGFIISLEKGDGQISRTIRRYIDMTSALLDMWTETNDATDVTDKLNISMLTTELRTSITTNRTERYKEQIKELAKKVEKFIKVLKILAIVYLTIRGIMFLVAAVQAIMTATLAGYKIVVGGATLATKAFNLVLSLNPIVAITLAIIALIFWVRAIGKNWEEWGASASLTLGILGTYISVIQSIRRNWDLITKAFSGKGIIAGLKAIGFAIVDALIQPLEQLATMLKNFTGIDVGVEALTLSRKVVQGRIQQLAGETPTGEVRTNSVNPETSRQEITNRSIESSIEEKQLTININDPEGRAEVDEGGTSPGVAVNVVPTSSFVRAGND